MVRCSQAVLFFLLSSIQPLAVQANHCYGTLGYHGPMVVSPSLGYSGFAGSGFGRTFVYQIGNPSLYYGPGYYSPQPLQPVSYSVPDNTIVGAVSKGAVAEPSKVPVVPSSTAARLRSLEHQARGDQRLRQQKWSEARAAYRSSVDAAPDRAEGHLRLGLCLVAIQRFDSAIHEFKRALFIDPSISQMDGVSKSVFGPESKMVRSSIISKLMDWVREDYTNPERLFLMGVILRFENDPRSLEFFEAAKRMKRSGDASHIMAFMSVAPAADAQPLPVPAPQNPQEIPKLNDKPVPISLPKAVVNLPNRQGPRNATLTGPLPGAPVPMPDL
jgi:hypothetical protein